ncbi:MAG: cytochrome c oxidase subunit 3 [Rhodospirillales bacterium]|jgi:cytochrome c oxidase subunit 3
MNIFHEITKKPWLTDPSEVEGLTTGGAFLVPAGKVGLRIFLVVITVIFALTTIAYADRMFFSNWVPMPESWVLWLNTAMLIASSLAMHWARLNTVRDNLSGVRDGLIFGGILTLVFLIGQLYVWQQMVGLGYYVNLNTANAFFYLVTALHGVHMLGGLIAWSRSMIKFRQISKSGKAISEIRLSVELCTTYWHYLLLIWLILFSLLLIS